MTSRKKSRSRRVATRFRSRAARAWAGLGGWLSVGRAYVMKRLRPWTPTVAADIPGKRGRTLRKQIAGVTRMHLQALGVMAPGHLLIVLQRTVILDERPLGALLQVFEDGAGRRRHVLFLAQSVEGRQVGDEELIATLRQQLQQVVADELGTLRLSVPLTPSRPRRAPAVVPLRRREEAPPFDEDVPPPEDYEGYDGRMAAAAEG